jgi:uncharacterized protein YifE (UPF0438 family)
MYIDTKIKELLSVEETIVLERHGDLLRDLANGAVEPITPNQEHFVLAVRREFENSEGVSAKAWRKYLKLNDLFDYIADLEQMAEQNEQKINKLDKQLTSLEKFVEILELDLKHKEAYVWNEEALAKLSEDNKLVLKLFERALVLKEMSVVTQEQFDKFAEVSDLWKALHNYKKVQHPQTTYSSSTPRVRLDICSSCGGAVIDGHCKCSN